jgi:hypothetical protein
MKIIEMVISPGGDVRVETRGFAGDECREASRFLESAMGKTTSESLTAEFYHTRTEQQQSLNEGD